MQVLWNGKGDFFLLLIFMLCIERLFHMINGVVEDHEWNPIQLSRGGPQLYYLAFVDDILLLGEASCSQDETIRNILDIFCTSSGQKVSVEKTRIFFSRNARWHTREHIGNYLGFQKTHNLGKYLGVPLHHERVSKESYQFVRDKITQRLSSWKASMLSLVGRLTLSKALYRLFKTMSCRPLNYPLRSVWKLTKNARILHGVTHLIVERCI